MVLIPVSLVALLYRIRIVRLREAQRVRDRIARDLHDDLGSTMSTINIYGKVLEKKLAGGELASFATSIQQASASAAEGIGDIVWAEDPSKDEFIHLAARIRSHFLDLVEHAGVSGEVLFDPRLNGHRLDGSLRRDLFLIYKEAVNNALKHSKASRIGVRMDRTTRAIALRISDSGTGFRPEEVTRIGGMRNMRERAEGRGGSYNVRSDPGTGTVVEVVLPLG